MKSYQFDWIWLYFCAKRFQIKLIVKICADLIWRQTNTLSDKITNNWFVIVVENITKKKIIQWKHKQSLTIILWCNTSNICITWKKRINVSNQRNEKRRRLTCNIIVCWLFFEDHYFVKTKKCAIHCSNAQNQPLSNLISVVRVKRTSDANVFSSYIQ